MARQLVFVLNGVDYPFFIEKVDRDKLYGKVDTLPKDPAGRPRQKGYLDEWRCVVIAQTGRGHLTKHNF